MAMSCGSWRITCSWAESQPLQGSCKVSCVDPEQGKHLEFNPESVTLGGCIQLSPPQAQEPHELRVPCHIHVSSQSGPGTLLKEFLLVSQSRLCEVHSASGDYLASYKGERLEDSDEELPMYHVVARLEVPVGGCRIRLQGLGSEHESAWLMAIQLGVVRTANQQGAQKRFHVDAMNALLADAKLSDKAKDFKGVFEMYQNGQQQALPLDLMMAAMGGIGSLGIANSGESVAGVPSSPQAMLAQLLPGEATGKRESEKSRDILKCDDNTNEISKDEKPHSCYGNVDVSKQLQDMEQKIMSRIDKMEKVQNERMERIISLLEKQSA